jgi:hypothetical protein
MSIAILVLEVDNEALLKVLTNKQTLTNNLFFGFE